nr:unnamed protein product [Spirometra erinaceieuropaei]
MQHLAMVFDRLQQFGVVLNPSKCVFGVPSLEFLGHLVDSHGIRPLLSKVAAIRDFPPPTSKHQLQRFLGMVNFYRRFLPNCADTIPPLTSLLSGSKRTFELTPAALRSFEQLSPGIDLTEMAGEQRPVGPPCDEDVSGLQLQELPLTTGNGNILCDVSTPSHCPFVPPSLRRKFFSSLRTLSDPGSRATDKLVYDRFVWPGMHKDLKAWTQACIACQQSKTQQHNKAPIGTFPGPGSRFSHVHLEIVCPLPLSNGCTRIRTTAYHPAANGMVEQVHRQLKASLRATDDPENWKDQLSLVLLGIRSALKPDLDCSAAELVFGATVRLPGEMISPTPQGAVEDPTNLLLRLRQFTRTLSPVPPRSSASPSYLEKDLAKFSHVYPRSCPNAAAICWYHITFGVKARRCISPCSFTSKQSKRVKTVNPKVCAANLRDGSYPGHTFYVRETRSDIRFLVDTGAQLSVIPTTPADRRCPNPGLFLQAVNTSPITTFGTCSLSLDIGVRRLFPWVFVVADIPCAILGADFLAAFDLLVDCRQSRLHDKTTNLTVRGISSSDASRHLAVLDPEPENPFRHFLVKYPGLTRPNFKVSISPHDVVHHIRTTGPPVFSLPRHLAPTRLAAAKAEFGHMLQMGIIHQCESPWASSVHMVSSAATGDWRPRRDY